MLEQMIQYLLPDQLLNNKTCKAINNVKHTNLLGYEAKSLLLSNGFPDEPKQ